MKDGIKFTKLALKMHMILLNSKKKEVDMRCGSTTVNTAVYHPFMVMTKRRKTTTKVAAVTRLHLESEKLRMNSNGDSRITHWGLGPCMVI